MVAYEADRRDQDLADALRVEGLELDEDVRAEPRLPGRALALERERPVGNAGLLGDESRRLEQLVAVRVALGEDPLRQAVGREDDVRVRRRPRARPGARRTARGRASSRRRSARLGRRAPARAGRGTRRSRYASSAAPARARRAGRHRLRARARRPPGSTGANASCPRKRAGRSPPPGRPAAPP